MTSNSVMFVYNYYVRNDTAMHFTEGSLEANRPPCMGSALFRLIIFVLVINEKTRPLMYLCNIK